VRWRAFEVRVLASPIQGVSEVANVVADDPHPRNLPRVVFASARAARRFNPRSVGEDALRVRVGRR